MPNAALIAAADVRIPAISAVVDGFPDYTVTLETNTGGEPLEDGRDVTDHVVARQAIVELTGWVTDLNGGDRPGEAWETIRELHKSAAVIMLISELGVWDEMIIRRAEAPRRGRRGLHFTLKMEEVIRVGVVDSDLPARAVTGAQVRPVLMETTSRAGQMVTNAGSARSVTDRLANALGDNTPLRTEARMASAQISEVRDASLRTQRLLMAGMADPRSVSIPDLRQEASVASVATGRAQQALRPLRQRVRQQGDPTATLLAEDAARRGDAMVASNDRLAASIDDLSRQTIALARTGELDRGRLALPSLA